jgi:hypothetical protein
MGLDLVEFVMEVEEVFEFRFDDEVVAGLRTPRLLIDYLTAHLPTAADHVCWSQRVFYRLRSAVAARFACPRSALRPDTLLLALIPADARAAFWDGVRQDCGASAARHWPRLDAPGWCDLIYDLVRPPRIGTLREATEYIARHVTGSVRIVKGHEAGWTRAEVAQVVHRIIQACFGLTRHQYTEDSRWDRDLGVD